MKLTDCKSLLTELDVRPSKTLGQNFLIDSNILNIVVRAARLESGDIVLEIGPGLGVLTARLAERTKLLVAVEKDVRLCEWLKQHFSSADNLQLLCADALEVPVTPAADECGVKNGTIHLPDERFKLVANLPYSISSALLERFVENPPRPVLMVLTLQREMAERLAAKPSTKDYGALTLFTQLRYHVTIEHIVSPGCFYPAPDVESAIAVLDRREPSVRFRNGTPFKPLVRAAFSQRRKMMRKLLIQSGFDSNRVDAALEKLKIPATARGEELSLEAFVLLANELM